MLAGLNADFKFRLLEQFAAGQRRLGYLAKKMCGGDVIKLLVNCSGLSAAVCLLAMESVR